MSGADFLMGNVGLKKKRAAVEVSPEQINEVVRQMSEAAERAADIGEGVAAVARAAVVLVGNSGLTRECLVVLLQDRMGNQRNGKLMPKGTVDAFLQALVDLDGLLVEKPKAVRR